MPRATSRTAAARARRVAASASPYVDELLIDSDDETTDRAAAARETLRALRRPNAYQRVAASASPIDNEWIDRRTPADVTLLQAAAARELEAAAIATTLAEAQQNRPQCVFAAYSATL